MVYVQRQGLLFGYGDSALFAVTPHEELDQVGYGAMLLSCCDSETLLDRGVNSQIEGGGFACYQRDGLLECNANVTQISRCGALTQGS